MITITNCTVQFRKLCPMRWEQLEPTADEAVCLCEMCWRQVFLCRSDTEASYHAMEGHCVAVLGSSVTQSSSMPCGFTTPSFSGCTRGLSEKPIVSLSAMPHLPAGYANPP